jgi:hypothetical protein
MARNKSGKSTMAGGCLSLFGLPFLGAGLFMTWLHFSGYVRWLDAQRWEEVPCSIESAELKVSRGDDSTTYKAEAVYSYAYGGRVYSGERVALSGGSDNVGSFQQDAHRELSRHLAKPSRSVEADPSAEPGPTFRCYVNPANPSEAVLYRDLRWQMQAFSAIFALTFPAVGAGLVVAGFLGTRASRRMAGLRAKHPDEPWKWRDAWAGTTIPERTGMGGTALHLYTLWSGIIVFSLISAAVACGAFQTSPFAWLLLIFVALWAIPAAFSVRRIRHRIAVGASSFEPKELPAWPGGAMQGHILLKKPPPMRSHADVSLTCEKKTTRGSGDNRSVTSEKIWSDQQSVPHDMITRDLAGFRLPVGFTLPADAPESGMNEDNEIQHTWKLVLKVPGTAIHSEFEIPVFRTAKSPPVTAGNAAPLAKSIHDGVAADLPDLLAANRIRAEFDAAGIPVRIHCPPARHRAMIVFLIIFDMIWTGAAVLLVKQNAPLIFLVVWPVSAAAIWLSVIWQLLHQRTVTLDAAGLQVRNRLGPFGWNRDFTKSRVISFSHDSNMSSGNTRYYRVRLEDVLGKKTTLVDGITGSNAAEALKSRFDQWKRSS